MDKQKKMIDVLASKGFKRVTINDPILDDLIIISRVLPAKLHKQSNKMQKKQKGL